MQTLLNQQVWIALHLLYANSSQALDVYQGFVAHYKKEIESNKKITVFKKLAQLHRKIDTVQTAGPFNIFEEHKSNYWLDIYNKNPKNHQIVLVGILIFGLKIDEIEQALKISKQKIRFFLNQIFKKIVVVQPTNRNNLSKHLTFRKINDHKVSDFFIRENLVEYSLNILGPREVKLIEDGFNYHSEYKGLSDRYKKITEDIRKTINYQMSAEDIRVTYMASHTNNLNEDYLQRFQGKKLLRNKVFIAGSTLAIICFSIIFLRPKWIKNVVENNAGQQILLQEVKSQMTASENNLDEINEKINLNELAVSVSESKIDSKSEILASKNQKLNPEPLDRSKTDTIKSNLNVSMTENKKVQKGGLYRGTIVVTDLDQVSDLFTDKIVNLGGKKAGEVQLGWRKNNQTSYYHFLISNSNLADIKSFLEKFGELNFKFEDHPRQVPDGVVRIIVEIKKQ